jgi:polyribonucleotide nucleotidyltransferase
MGLITDTESPKYAILSDILGDEDHLGDMDFKVTGTRDGITATQMDIKCDGLSYEILEKALMQARDGRMHILDKIQETIPGPREDYKPNVPRIVTMTIPKELIGAVIGPGGKVIQGIQEESGATVSIDEVDEGGYIEVAANNKAAIDKALQMINAIVELPEEGKVYHGKVASIMDFGAFVQFMPNRDGLLHISEISWECIPDMEASGIKEGDELDVKLIEIDKKTGKYRLSLRALQPKPEGYQEPQRRERPQRREGDRNDRGDRGPRNNGNHHNGGNRGERGPRNNHRE